MKMVFGLMQRDRAGFQSMHINMQKLSSYYIKNRAIKKLEIGAYAFS